MGSHRKIKLSCCENIQKVSMLWRESALTTGRFTTRQPTQWLAGWVARWRGGSVATMGFGVWGMHFRAGLKGH